ncbi:unnamed protein product [Haemonchus placei]|uniref:DUF1758 domain-containing protein n=1 Tax=Haemonchus placei TaxID=6290 RepID=A0A0N4W3S2_HAEPC|nr:unnamed protein product [Haemonchus placei]
MNSHRVQVDPCPKGTGTTVQLVSESEPEYEQSDYEQDSSLGIQLVARTGNPERATLMTATLVTVQAYMISSETKERLPLIILLDIGAQTSFISKAAVKQHQLDVFEEAPMTTYAFGAVSTTEQSGKMYVTLVDSYNHPLSLVLDTKDRLTIPSSPTCLTEKVLRQ